MAAPVTTAGMGTGETIVGSHVFRIDNFSATKELGVGKSINSSTFHIGGHAWYIECYPCGINQDSAGMVSLYLRRQVDEYGSKVSGYCKFALMESLKDGSFKKLESGNPDTRYSLAEDDIYWLWGVDQFIQRKHLERLLKDDCFQVRCVVFIHKIPTAPSPDMATETMTGSHVLTVDDSYSKTRRLFGTGECIESSNFRVGRHRWCLDFYPCGEDENKDDGRVTVNLYLHNPAYNAEVKVRFEVTLLTRAGQIISSTQDFSTFTGRSDEYDCNFLIMMEHESSPLLQDGIQIRCDISVVSGITATPNVCRGVSGDLHGTQQVRGDVTFEVGNRLFTGHKCVLTTRCTSFMDIFGKAGNQNSGVTDRVHIDDMEPQVFEALLHFIYTDALPEIHEDDKIVMAQGLLVAADRYGMERLKLICGDMLCSYMNDAHTAIDMLELAAKLGCHKLIQRCKELLKSQLAKAAPRIP